MASSYKGSVLESVLGFKIRYKENDSRSVSRGNVVPQIPPLALCAIALWCASAFFYVLLEHEPLDAIKTLYVLLAIISAFACIAFAICRNLFFCIILFLSLGCVVGTNGALAFHEKTEALPEDGEYVLVLRDDPKTYTRGSYASVACNLDGGRTINAKAFFNGHIDLLYNARLSAKCSISKSSDEYEHSNYLTDLHAQINIASYETLELPFLEGAIYEIRKRAIALLHEYGGKQGGLLQALLCGYRPTMIEDGIYEDYKKCGIAHIVAVSGAHLAIVTIAVGLMLKALRFPRLLYVAITLLFLFAYLLFAGAPISAMRSAIMCSLFLISGLAKRRNATLNSLSVCSILFILLDPASCVSVSLFLSAASTFGIAMFASLFSEWSLSYPKIVQNMFSAPLSMTAASNIATLPFSVSIFGMLPVVAPITNILVTPIFTLVCVIGVMALSASLTIPELSNVSIGFVSTCALPMNTISSFLASLPNACLEVSAETATMLALSAVVVFALYKFKPKISGKHLIVPLIAVLVFCGISLIRIPASTGDRIVMLDVGQGDAFIIESKGKTLLIDTGNDASKLRESLNYAGIFDIEAVSISHSDSDHCESLDEIRSICRNAKFLCANQMIECDCNKCHRLMMDAESLFGASEIYGVDVGSSFKIGNFDIKVIWPRSYKESGANPDSLCLLASLDENADGVIDWSALFTGDAESKEIESMISTERIGDIDILKVGHHGSKQSLSDTVIDVLKPEYALISVGKENTYGHPAKETIQILEKGSCKILRTDELGVVELSFSENGISVTSERRL